MKTEGAWKKQKRGEGQELYFSTIKSKKYSSGSDRIYDFQVDILKVPPLLFKTNLLGPDLPINDLYQIPGMISFIGFYIGS